jgi:hypothetical protein
MPETSEARPVVESHRWLYPERATGASASSVWGREAAADQSLFFAPLDAQPSSVRRVDYSTMSRSPMCSVVA